MGIRNGRFRPEQVRAELLRVLDRWGRLVESDLKRLMDIALAVRFDADLRRELERENLVRVEQVGDEPVLAITDAGRQWLEAYRRRQTQPAPSGGRDRRRRRPDRTATAPANQEPLPGLEPSEAQNAPG